MERVILHRFFAGTASIKDKELIRNWLKNPENKETIAKEREFYNALLLSENDMPEAQIEPSEISTGKVFKEVLKIAAIVILVSAIAGWLYKEKINSIEETINIIQVPPGQRVNLTLSDGTQVSLNSGTEFKYPAFFTGSERKVVLNGEAFFDVKYNEGTPFLVHTQKCEIEVLGTKFNVEDYKHSDDFSASLIEGSIKLTNVNDITDVLILKPNYRATFLNGKLNASGIKDYDYFRWQEGLICFKDTEFGELMIRFAKCYDVKIFIENPEIAKKEFNGKFRISDGIDNALRILQKDAKYSYEKNEDGTVIYIK